MFDDPALQEKLEAKSTPFVPGNDSFEAHTTLPAKRDFTTREASEFPIYLALCDENEYTSTPYVDCIDLENKIEEKRVFWEEHYNSMHHFIYNYKGE